MKILIDIGHPAHVHYFRNLYHIMNGKHQIWVTCRDTDIVKYLLKHYDIPFEIIGAKTNGLVSKLGKQLIFARRIRQMITQHGIDIAMGVSGAAVHGALKTKAKSILFDDDDQSVQPLMSKLVTPFADTVLSPDSLAFEKIKHAVYYPGFHELAYLHPKVFTPNPAVPARYGISNGEIYFILRFNAFKAHHDLKEGGMSIAQKRRLITLLSPYGRVFITTEAVIDAEFEPFKMPIALEDIHDFLAYAQVLVSDSQTMSSEAAVLGTPSFRCNSFCGRISYLEEEEKQYKLTSGFLPHQFECMADTIAMQLQSDHFKVEYQKRRRLMLSDKINVTGFWVWFVENYPDSLQLYNTGMIDFNDFK